MKHKIRKSHRQFFIGIILIIIGGVLAAINLDWLSSDLRKIVISWQMLLIVLGIVSLCKRHLLSGVIFLTVGCFFIVPKLSLFFDVPDNFVSLYWPVILIIGGLFMIICRFCGVRMNPQHFHKHCCNDFRDFAQNYQNEAEQQHNHCHNHHQKYHNHHHKQQYREFITDSEFRKVNIFGYGEYCVIDSEFSGGSLTAVFGGMEVDLRKAILPEGDTYLKIDAVFSGITLLFPDDWAIETRLDVVAGGIEDFRKSKMPRSDRRLILCGSVVLSGVEIQN